MQSDDPTREPFKSLKAAGWIYKHDGTCPRCGMLDKRLMQRERNDWPDKYYCKECAVAAQCEVDNAIQ